MSKIQQFRMNETVYDLEDASAVKFDAAQELTAAQKATARSNIDVGEIDTTLAIQGAAAESKTTGDAITGINTKLDAITEVVSYTTVVSQKLAGETSWPDNVTVTEGYLRNQTLSGAGNLQSTSNGKSYTFSYLATEDMDVYVTTEHGSSRQIGVFSGSPYGSTYKVSNIYASNTEAYPYPTEETPLHVSAGQYVTFSWYNSSLSPFVIDNKEWTLTRVVRGSLELKQTLPLTDHMYSQVEEMVPEVDDTLAVQGSAADAKATGDAIGNVDERLGKVETTLILEKNPVLTTINNKYIGTGGEQGTSTAFKTYYFQIPENILQVRFISSNCSDARNVYIAAFYNSSTFSAETAVALGDILNKSDGQMRTYTYNVPEGAVYGAVCGSNDIPEDGSAPSAVLISYADASKAEAVTEKLNEQTAKAEVMTPEYLAHRYIQTIGIPSGTSSNSWNLYKADVSDVDAVVLKSYFNGNAKPLWSFFKIEYADANVTSMRESDLEDVVPGKEYAADGAVQEYITVPPGMKTMAIACYAEQASVLQLIVFRYGNWNIMKDTKTKIEFLENRDARYRLSSYYRDVRWGPSLLNKHYHSAVGETTPFSYSAMTAAEYFTIFNELVEDYSDYVTVEEMGLASDNETMMYYYTLNPLTAEDEILHEHNFARPKIIISAGQHGFEKVACFGLYFFVKDLLENWQDNETLAYIRNHVQLIIMPLLNPYGFTHDVYTNTNGVNLNRNWGTTGWSSGTEGTTSYGGPTPFSEVETQYARDVILDNLDAIWLCDYHNNGQTAPGTPSGYLWHSFALMTYDDPYFTKAINAAKWHIEDTTAYLYKDYPTKCSYAISGAFTDDNAPSHQGLIVAYARENNIMAATMEAAAAFIGSGNNRWQPDIQHMNADMIGNWIRCIISEYAKLAD